MGPLQQRIQQALRAENVSQAELARRVGIRQPSMSALLNGAAERTKHILEIGRALRVRAEWLQWGTGPMRPRAEEIPVPAAGERWPATVEIGGDSYALIPSYDARAAAGAGGEATDAVAHRLAFRMEWLRQVTSAPVERLGVLEIDNDSMEPTLRPGDHGLIDTGQTDPAARQGIYVLRAEQGLIVKRVSIDPTSGRLTLKSDNPDYETQANVRPTAVRVLGRLIWIGRRVG